MSRFDIARLRKENGMSQGELANLLQITQSFLSAIENGRSPLPIEKEERLREIFNLRDLKGYTLSRKQEAEQKMLNDMTDSDLFNQLLSRFHKQAHSSEDAHHHNEHHERINDLQNKFDLIFKRYEILAERNDLLWEENNRLRTQIDDYRQTIDRLRDEIFTLKNK